MKHLLVCVRDTVADSFFKPFVASNEADAVRQLSRAALEKGPLHDNFDDYRFIVVGYFDFQTGVVEGCAQRVLTVPKPSIPSIPASLVTRVEGKALTEMAEASLRGN